MASSQLQVSAKLLRNYRSAVPIDEGSNLVAFRSSSDQLALASVASNGEGFVLIENDASDTGWSLVSLQGANLVGRPAVIAGADGLFNYFALDSAGGVWRSKDEASGTGQWSPLAPVPGVLGLQSLDAPLTAVYDNHGIAHLLFMTRGFEFVDTWEDATKTGGWSVAAAVLPAVPAFLQPANAVPTGALKVVRDEAGLLRVFIGFNNGYWGLLVQGDVPGTWDQPQFPIPSPAAPNLGFLFGKDSIVCTRDSGAALTWIYALGEVFVVQQGSDDASQPGTLTRPPFRTFPTLNQTGCNCTPFYDASTRQIEMVYAAFSTDENSAPIGHGALAYARPTNTSLADWAFQPIGDNVFPIDPSTGELGPNTMAAFRNPSTMQLEVFAIDANLQIQFVAQDPASPTGWGEMIDIGYEATQIYPTLTGTGGLEMFLISPDGGTRVLRRDPTSLQWNDESVAISKSGQVEAYDCYSTEIVITDAHGVANGGVPCTVWASDPVALRINGETFHVNATGRTASVRTVLNGTLTIEMATDTIDSPELHVTTPFMQPGESISVIPQEDVRARIQMATVDVDKLLGQRDRNGAWVIPEPYRGDRATMASIAKAVHNSALLAGSAANAATASSNGASFLARNRHPHLVRHNPPGVPPSRRRIDYAAVPAQSWQIEFSGDRAVYHALSADDVTAVFARCDRDRAVRHAAAATLDGWFGIDWDSLWRSVSSGAVTLHTWTVDTVVDPVTKAVTAVRAALEVIVNGVVQSFNFVVATVEQAFDAIEGLLSVVGTKFDELVQWLSFFFDWNDILLTKDAIKIVLTQGLELAPTIAQCLKDESTLLFDSAADRIDEIVASLLRTPLSGETAVEIQRSNPPPAGTEDSRTHNIVMAGLMNSLSIPSIGAPRPRMAVLAEPMDDIQVLFTACADEFSAASGFAEAREMFTRLAARLASNPDAAAQWVLEELIVGLAALMKTGIQAGSALVRGIIGAIGAALAAMKVALEAVWDIPFVSDLYRSVSGADLTALDLMALVVAVPATLFYKLAFNAAPIDESGLARMKRQFTAATVLANSGLGIPATALAPSPDEAWSPEKILAVTRFAASLELGFLTAGADVLPASEWGKGTYSDFLFSVTAVGLEWFVYLAGCPWYFKSVSPFGTSPESRVAMAWLMFGLSPVLDLVSMTKTKKKKSLNGSTGILLEMLCGIEVLIVAGYVSDHTDGPPDGLRTAANLIPAFPMLFRYLRLWPMIEDPDCRGAMAGIDFVGNLVSGTLNFALAARTFDSPTVTAPTALTA